MAEENKDEGPKLDIKVGVGDGLVITIFSQALTTFSLPPDEAIKMGEALILHANQVKHLAGT